MLARLKDTVLAGFGRVTGSRGLRLGFQVGKISLTEGAFDNVKVKCQVRGQVGVKCTSKKLPSCWRLGQVKRERSQIAPKVCS